jgi:hypothetical protein
VKQQKPILECLLHHKCHIVSSHMPMISDTCRYSLPRSKMKCSAKIFRLPTIEWLVIKWESSSQSTSWLRLTKKLDDVTGKEMQLNKYLQALPRWKLFSSKARSIEARPSKRSPIERGTASMSRRAPNVYVHNWIQGTHLRILYL